MKKKITIAIIFLMAVFFIYLFLFKKDKNLHFLPENADYIFLIDTKNVGKTFVYEYLTHPKKWIDTSGESRTQSLRNSGLELPDFIQIFHVKGTPLDEWYSVFQISDHPLFVSFLKTRKFTTDKPSVYKNPHFLVKIFGDKCLITFSNNSLDNVDRIIKIFQSKLQKPYLSDQLIGDSHGSFSTISGSSIAHFPINILENEIVLENALGNDFSPSFIEKLVAKPYDFSMELDQKNIELLSLLFPEKKLSDLQIKKISAFANLEKINDTIVSYGFDENFNEVKNISFQKIVQPNYIITAESKNTELTWERLKKRNWLNQKNECIAIPFLPNSASKDQNNIQINSTHRKTTKPNLVQKNYMVLKSNPLLTDLIPFLSKEDKKNIGKINYFFFGKENHKVMIKLVLKKDTLPLILK